MYYYAFTLRPTKRNPVDTKLSLIENQLMYIQEEVYPYEDGIEFKHHYEVVMAKNGQHNIHIHSLIKSPRRVYVNRLLAEGFKVHLQECDNRNAWDNYINKQGLSTPDDVRNYIKRAKEATVRNMPPAPVGVKRMLKRI